MKLRFNCMQCFQENGHPLFEFHPVELNDAGLYTFTCNFGHETTTVIQQQKFEVLFDLGALALIDGYPREAITSIASSLERFYEFYIKVICLKHKINIDNFKSSWKHIASQSERQFGAYIFLYLIENKNKEPLVIDNEKPTLENVSKRHTKTWKEFRNAVVHKGYIPSTTETLAYGNIVYSHLNELIKDLKNNCEKFISQATFIHLSRVHNDENKLPISTMSIPTIISLNRGEDTVDTLEEALKSLESYREYTHYI